MDTATGIQPTLSVEDTGQTLIIPLRITDADNLFSYQFKVAFDTGCFTFVAAEQDFGTTGEKNILTANGGSIISICQLQANPPATDTVEFSCSITGTDESMSVSGDGLVGVLYLKSKLDAGDTTTITVCDGLLAGYDQQLVSVEEYEEGTYMIPPPPVAAAAIAQPGRTDNRETFSLSINSNKVHFAVPSSLFNAEKIMRITIHTLDGRLRASRLITTPVPAMHLNWSPAEPGQRLSRGTYLCSVEIGTARISRSLSIR
jgi:hypothetical protein